MADDKLDKVFVSVYLYASGALNWALDHFDGNKTKFILVNPTGIDRVLQCTGKCEERKVESLLSKKIYFQIKYELLVPRGTNFKEDILELINKHGMRKFVTDEQSQREITEFFNEKPNLSCEVRVVDCDGKLISTRYRTSYPSPSRTQELLQRKKEEKVLHQQENEQLKRNIHLLTKNIDQLKLENGELKNKLEENVYKLQEQKEQKEVLQVTLQRVKEERDKFQQERDNALKQFEELRKEKENIPNSSRSTLTSEFTLQELKEATQDFSNSLKLGEGGYGCVYKGSLRRMSVAIKKLNPNSLQGVSQFQQEVAILTKIRHPYLVTLVGSCSQESALVYEFLPNGSLEDRLSCTNNTSPLTWQVRTRIIGEICLALIFLHSSKPHLVIHGDLNPHNILLDANFVSKLGDFGISRFVKQPDTNSTALYRTSRPAGTFAYSDPEYMTTGELTPKSDVYSLGIIILRILTGKPPLNLANNVEEAMRNGNLQSMIDKSAGNWPFDQVKRLAKISLRCAEMSRRRRPDLISGVWAVVEPLMKSASLSVTQLSATTSTNENRLPHHFICPILQDVMKDPHIAADGFTYEAREIRRWLNNGHNTSPMTNLPLPHSDLIPNHALRSAIQEWLEHHPQS